MWFNTNREKAVLIAFIVYLVNIIFVPQLFSSQENTVKLDTLRKEAKKLIAAKKYEEAIKIYETIKMQFPQRLVEAEVNVARCYFWQGDDNRAISWLRKVVDNYPNEEDVTEAIMLIGEIYHYRAVKAFEHVKAENLSDDKAEIITRLVQTGDPYEYQANLESAIKRFEQVINSYPASKDMTRAMFSLSICQAERKEYAKAFAGFEKLIQNYPAHKETWNAQVVIPKIYVMTKEYNKAIEHYEKILPTISSDSDRIAEVNMGLGECYLKKGEHKLALKHLATAIEKTSKHGLSDSCYVLRGKIYEDMKEYDKAFAEYQSVSPYDLRWVAEANLGIGSCYLSQGKWRPALDHLRTASSKAKNRALKATIRKKIVQAGRMKMWQTYRWPVVAGMVILIVSLSLLLRKKASSCNK